MKYKAILSILRALIHVKRALWRLGRTIGGMFLRLSTGLAMPLVYLSYRARSWSRKNFGPGAHWWLRRSVLQGAIFIILLLVALPDTKVYSAPTDRFLGQRSKAYEIFSQEAATMGYEEVVAVSAPIPSEDPSRLVGMISAEDAGFLQDPSFFNDRELAGPVAGGSAILKPTLLPGASAGARRVGVEEYTIQPGDTLSGISYRYNVSIATIVWENDLSARAVLKVGSPIRIPPATGVMHTVKRGDTLIKLARTYQANIDDIVRFNLLSHDGTDLIIGERIMIPDGTPPTVIAPTRPSVPSSRPIAAAPPASQQTPSAGGFVWPSAARTITQYFGWLHSGIDIAGPLGSATYAVKGGTVETAACGWNGGYGCYVIIDHGGGVKTLYGHHSELLVSAGQAVTTGQTIALMGATGRVRGRTGVHLHFEVIISGSRVNPLGYVR